MGSNMRYKEYTLKTLTNLIKMSESYQEPILEALIKATESNMFTQHELRLIVVRL